MNQTDQIPDNKQLFFSLLGTPAVYSHKELIRISRIKVRTMAYYLASQQHSSSRRELLLLFWPDASPEDGPRHLRETLSKLRGSLPQKELLQKQNDEIWFDRELTGSDVINFLNLSDQIFEEASHYSSSTTLPDHLLHKIETALDLWHGDEFLNTSKLPSNENFDQWLTQTQSNLDRRKTKLTETLIEHLVKCNQIKKAIPYLDKITAVDNFNFNFHHQLLTSLVNNQEYGIAKYYYNYIENFAQNNQINLKETILFDILHKIKQKKTIFKTVNENKWQQMFDYHLTYVGNEKALEKIASNLHAEGICLILGGKGSGKSRTAFEFFHRFLRDYHPVHIESHAQLEMISFTDIHGVLRDLITKECLGVREKELISKIPFLLPEMIAKFPDIPESVTLPPALQHQQMMDSILELLERIAQQKKICFVFDNIQFCDNSSLTVISHLIKNNFFPYRGVLLLTADSNFPQSKKAQILGSQFLSSHSIHMQPLIDEEFSSLLSELTGQSIPDSLNKKILGATGRNPMLGLNTIVSILENEVLTDDQISELVVSEVIAYPEMITNSLNKLSKEAQTVLQYCAFLGNHFRPIVIENIPQIQTENLTEIFEELENRQFIAQERDNDVDQGYRFRHSILQDEVLNHLSIARKRQIAFGIIHSLQTTYKHLNEYNSSIYARLYNIAGAKHEAFNHYIIAAKFSSKSFSPEASFAALEIAESLIPAIQFDLLNQEIYELYSFWIYLSIQYNRPEMAEEKTGILLHFGKLRKDNFLIGIGYYYEALCLTSFQSPSSQSLEIFDQAISILSHEKLSKELLSAKLEKANIFYIQHTLIQATEICDNVLKTISENTNKDDFWLDLKQQALYILALILTRQAKLKKADELLTQINATPINSDVLRFLTIKNIHAWVALHQGNLKAAEAMTNEALSIAHQINNEAVLCQAYGTMGRVQYYMGNIDKAIHNLNECIKFLYKFQLTNTATMAYIAMGDIHRRFDNYEKAKESYMMALEISNKNPNPTIVNACGGHLALIEGLSGNPTSGINMLNAISIDMQAVESTYQLLQTKLDSLFLASIYPQQSNPLSEIEDELKYILKESKENQLLTLYLFGMIILALVKIKLNKRNTAINILHECIRLCIENNNIIYELSAYSVLLDNTSEINESTRERILYLLEYLRNNASDKEITQKVQVYCQNIALKLNKSRQLRQLS